MGEARKLKSWLLSWARYEGTAVILKFKMWLYNNTNYLKVTIIFVGLIYMFSVRGTKQIAKYSPNPADDMPLKTLNFSLVNKTFD